MNGDADALSRLGLDFEIDPSLQNYYNIANTLKNQHPCVDGPVQPDNLPSYRRNFKGRQSQEQKTSPTNTLYTTISNLDVINGITNVPISIHQIKSCENYLTSACCTQLNYQPVIANALQASTFKWVLNRLGSGSFSSVCTELNIPFSVPLACDITLEGRSILQELGNATQVANGSLELLEILGVLVSSFL